MNKQRLHQIRDELRTIVFPQGGGLLVQELIDELERRIPIFECPKCGGAHFGCSHETGITHCHDQFNQGCRWSGRYNFQGTNDAPARLDGPANPGF